MTKLIPTGTDLTLTVTMRADDAFPADERPFFAVRYKYKTTITQAGLFFTTDTLTALSDKSYSSFPVVGDNTWRTAIVDMQTFDHKNWTGTITSFRFDPTNPSDTDSVYQVSRVGFFPSEAEAQRFLDAPDYSEPTQFIAPLQRVLVPGGCLADGFDRADFMLRSTAIDHPSETTVVRFRPKGATGEESVAPLCQTNRRGFTCFVAKKAGEYHLAHGEIPLDDIANLEAKTQLAIQIVLHERVSDPRPNSHRGVGQSAAGGDRKGFHRNLQFRRIRLDYRSRGTGRLRQPGNTAIRSARSSTRCISARIFIRSTG